MSQNMYELIALGARYAFSALMVLIVLRAWRITIVDSRRANTLRRMSPDTGLSGELIVMEGDGKARRGMRYPVTREGMIGTARRADIRIRHSSVRRRHAYFQMTEDGLSVRAHAGAPLRDGRGRPAKELLLEDGAQFLLGRVRLMLVLAEAADPIPARAARRRAPAKEAPNDLFDAPEPVRAPRRPARREDAEDLFEPRPAFRPRPEKRLGKPVNADEYFDADDDMFWENHDDGKQGR